MSQYQYKLFEYTKANDLLVGDDVVQADRTKCIVKSLQSQKKMVENWRLDIFCRDPNTILDLTVTKVDSTSAAASYGRYSISIAVRPTALKPYRLSVAYFHKRDEATAMLDTVKAYLELRYGV